MKDSTKKRLIIAGLVAVCVLLIFGISKVLYKEPVQTLPEESKPTKEMELVVDTEETGQVQDESESTEETKELVSEVETEKDADTTEPTTPPAYEEPEDTTPPADDTPSHGDTKDGMIYIDGFGWVPNEGGGGSGSNADDMYENGNKVGIMD